MPSPEFLRNAAGIEDGREEAHHLRRFLFCALFGFMVPVVLQIAAVYHLIKGIRHGEKFSKVKLVAGLICFALQIAFMYVLAVAYLAPADLLGANL